MAKREVQSRYKGSVLGVSWAVLNSILFLAIYTFVFGYVFKASWKSGADSDQLSFAVVLFLGLSMHGLLSECLTRAPSLVLSNATYVKKVVFPLELLAWVSLFGGLFQLVMALSVWLFVYLLTGGTLGINALYFLAILPPLCLWSLGFLWTFSALGVYLRDISQITGAMSMMLLFVAPIFYPITAIPDDLRWLLLANPLTPLVEEARSVLIQNEPLDFWSMGFSYGVSLFFAWCSFVLFQRTRKGFADVI
ncbi:MAG: lipopolysaccharide transport system permease protein [Candidatus Azotimanducaceae bacterium]|jgi:lipopolysaccharide transport system permease protein